MAEVAITVGGRNYSIVCRDGGEAHLKAIAAHVDRKAAEAKAAVGDVNEVRQLLFAALLLADEIVENAHAAPPVAASDEGARIALALAQFADRLEAVADTIEHA